MNDRVCLRCDWEGQTKSRTCPSCGAGLYRPPGAQAPTRRRWRLPSWRPGAGATTASTPSAAPAAETFDPAASSVSDPLGAPPASGRGGWITGAAVVFIAAIVIAVVQKNTPAPEAVPPARGLQGSLIYTGSEGETESRLWIWDLASGELRRGPRLPRPVDLIDAYQADVGAGWVGVTSSVEGELRASMLRNFSESDLAAPLLSGDVAAWSPGGIFVTAAEKAPSRCSRLQVESYAAGHREMRFSGPVCGDLVAIARDETVHVGITANGEGTIALVENGRVDPYLTGQMLLAAGGQGGVLVASSDCAGIAPGTSDQERCGGVSYATPDTAPIPYGAKDGTRLVPERFLGWTRDGATAFLLGSYGGVRGVYTVPFPISRPEIPTLLITSLATDVGLTQAYQGELFILRDGELLLIRPSGEQVPLRLPDGAPEPDGPILWMAEPGGP